MNLLKRFCHWGPLASMTMTGSISIATTSCITTYIWAIVFHIFVCLTLYSMWCALLIGPGHASENVANKDDKQHNSKVAEKQHDSTGDQQTEWSRVDRDEPANTSKYAAKTKNIVNAKDNPCRYCRKCEKFVLRKHHHCPWINNCIGQYNERYFINFLIFTIATTVQSTSHLAIGTYTLSSLVSIHTNEFLFNLFNIGLSIGILIVASVLLYTH